MTRHHAARTGEHSQPLPDVAPAPSRPATGLPGGARTPPALFPARALTAPVLLALQASAGNQAVVRLLRQPAATTLDGLDPKVKQRLQIANATVTPGNLSDLVDNFSGKGDSTPLPPGTRTTYGTGVPATPKFRAGLASTAADVLNITSASNDSLQRIMGFRENTTVQVALDLSKLGHVDGVWRFTYYRPPKPATGQDLLVEYLAPAAAAAPGGAQRLTTFGLLDSGYSAAERADLLQAVALAPDAALRRLGGLRFARGNVGPGTDAANYDPKTHQITVYDKAFDTSQLRFDPAGPGFATQGVWTIVHEIGHAVDLTPLRTARTVFNKGPQDAAAKAAHANASSESGDRAPDHAAKGPAKSAFQDAVVRDGGVAVSGYGATSRQEGYAEAFALYVADPAVLKTLRPNVFAYFEGQFNAPTAATPAQPAAAPPPKPPVKPPTKELARAARLRRAPETAVVDLTATDDELRRHIAADDWAGVAGVLQRYDAHRVRRERALWLDVWQLRKLALYLRAGGPGGKQPSPLLPLVENLLTVKLDATYFPVVAGASWSTVVHLLATYDEALVLDRAREIPRRHGAGILETVRRIAILTLGDAHHVPRALAFLGLEGQTGASARPTHYRAMNEGKPVGPAVDVPGGKVTTYDDVQDANRQGGWTGLDYEGADAPNTGWLQFGCRDAEGLDARGDHLGWVTGISAPITGQPGRIHWEKPENARWHVDAKSTEVPFYESKNAETRSSGQHITQPTRTAIFDRPDPGLPAVRAGFAKKPRAAKVVERVRLHSYLVRGMEVLYENSMVVEFTYFGPGDAPQRQNLAGTGGVVGSLLPVHHEALLSRFPAWTFYARR